MRLLGGAQRARPVGHLPVRAARGDRRQIEAVRRRQRQERELALGVELVRLAPVDAAGAAHLEAVADVGARELHPDVARHAVLDVQRPQEEQVADLERPALVLRAQRLGGDLEVAGARHQRVAGAGAVLGEQPVRRGGIGRGEDPVAGRIEGRGVDQRPVHRLGGRRGMRARALSERRRGHTDLVPNAPVYGDDPGPAAAPAPGVGVEELVRGDVVHLPGGCRNRARRGEERQPVEAPVGEERVEHLGAVDLRREDFLDARRGLRKQRPVVHDARGVDHGVHAAEPLGRERHWPRASPRRCRRRPWPPAPRPRAPPAAAPRGSAARSHRAVRARAGRRPTVRAWAAATARAARAAPRSP